MLSNGDLLSTFSSLCFCTTWGNMHPKNLIFLVMLYTVSKTILLWLAISSTFVNEFCEFFADNKLILLGTVCKYYFSFSYISVIQIRKQDQCYRLLLPGRWPTDPAIRNFCSLVDKAYIPAFAGKLSD